MLKSTLESLLREWGYNQWPAWLEAALSLTNLILILLLAWVSLRVTHRLVNAFHQRLKDKTPSAEEQRRIATLERVLFPTESLEFHFPAEGVAEVWSHGMGGAELLERRPMHELSAAC